MWTKISVCPDLECDERLWHAGLSPDGKMCFVAGFEDHVYIIWDVDESKCIWKQDSFDSVDLDFPPIEEWIDSNGYVSIGQGPGTGRYRIVGLNYNYPITSHEPTDISLRVDEKNDRVILSQTSTKTILASLEYETFSGDWAFATFSDDGSTIAVIEPYFITFFRNEANRG